MVIRNCHQGPQLPAILQSSVCRWTLTNRGTLRQHLTSGDIPEPNDTWRVGARWSQLNTVHNTTRCISCDYYMTIITLVSSRYKAGSLPFLLVTLWYNHQSLNCLHTQTNRSCNVPCTYQWYSPALMVPTHASKTGNVFFREPLASSHTCTTLSRPPLMCVCMGGGGRGGGATTHTQVTQLSTCSY